MHRYAIIGTGVAGLAAIEAIREVDAIGEIQWIGDDLHGYYSRPGLAYYLTGELSESLLFPFNKKDIGGLNAKIKNSHVAGIDLQMQHVVMEDGSTILYDRLLLSTGAASIKPDYPGIELDGVVKLDNLEDARRIIKLSRKARQAVVIGGGITALEIVEGLCSRGVKVHYFLRGNRYWGNVLDESESGLIEKLLEEQGIELHYETEIEEIIGHRGHVAGVVTKDGRDFQSDIVAVAIGVKPRLQLALKAGLDVGEGILVDQYMQTSVSNVYSAGDAAQVYDPVSKKYVLDSLWGLARAQGSTAGMNMAGIASEYCRPYSFNVSRLADLPITIIGAVGRGEDNDLVKIARGDSETWRMRRNSFEVHSSCDINRVRILIGEKTLLGAVVLGDQTLSEPLRQLINQHADITSIRPLLLASNAPISEILVGFWTDWSSAND